MIIAVTSSYAANEYMAIEENNDSAKYQMNVLR